MLRVRALRVSPPYDSLLFVYRTGPSQFDTDYYNNFIAPPASLLTGDLIDWLSRSAPMIVSDTSSDLQPNAVLEGNITRLYIDSSSSPAKAVIAARLTAWPPKGAPAMVAAPVVVRMGRSRGR